jgi:hypothetical protein
MRIPCDDEGRDWSEAAASQGVLKQTTEAREREESTPLQVSRRAQPCACLHFELLASLTVGNPFLLFDATCFVALCSCRLGVNIAPRGNKGCRWNIVYKSYDFEMRQFSWIIYVDPV